jgi:tetratricopeptide (TPR) repeat protein
MMGPMRKSAILGIVVLAGAACVTVTPLSPTMYIESPTPTVSAELSLDERIAVEDAWTALRQGRIDKARKILLDLPAGDPFRSAGLGYAAFILNNLAEAEAQFIAAVTEHPDLPLAYMGLAQVYQASGQPDLAYRNFLEVLKYEPENARARSEVEAIRLQKTRAYMTEAEGYVSVRNIARGKEAYLKALEFSPKLQAAHLGLARLYLQEKSYDNALFHLQTASLNDPKDAGVLAQYADGLYQSGQMSKSLDAYTRVLELDPSNAAARARAEAIRNKLGAVELPSQYEAIASRPAVTREDMAALISVKFKTALEAAPPRTPVIVDITTSWALRDIVKVAGYGIMEINSNRTFEPQKPVSRADLADILVRLVTILRQKGYRIIEQIPVDRIQVADVPSGHFSFPAVSHALALRLLDLAPDRTFGPDRTVPGEEAIKALDLLAGLIK